MAQISCLLQLNPYLSFTILNILLTNTTIKFASKWSISVTRVRWIRLRSDVVARSRIVGGDGSVSRWKDGPATALHHARKKRIICRTGKHGGQQVHGEGRVGGGEGGVEGRHEGSERKQLSKMRHVQRTHLQNNDIVQ